MYRTTNAGTSFTQCNWYPSTSQFLGTGIGSSVLDRDATNVNVRYLYGTCGLPSTPPATIAAADSLFPPNRGVDLDAETFPRYRATTGDWARQGWWPITASADIFGSRSNMDHHGHNGLMHSVDGGYTWTWFRALPTRLAVDALNGNVVVYGATKNDAWNKIYYSTNNGANWNEVTATRLCFGNAMLLALDPYRPGRIFISTGERSVGIFTPSNLPPPAPTIVRQPVSQSGLSRKNGGFKCNGCRRRPAFLSMAV